MKKILIFIAVLAITNILNAQISELVGLNPNQVLSVLKDKNRAFTLSFLETRNSDLKSVYQISYIDDNQERLALEVPSSFAYKGSIEADNINYIIFWDKANKILQLFSVKDSKVLSNALTFGADANLQQFYYQAYIMANNNLALTFKYLLSKEDKTRENGYDVLLINNTDLSMIGNYHEVKEAGDSWFNVIDVLSTNSGYVLMKEISEYSKKKFTIDLLFLDNDLKVLKSKLLTEEKNSFIPSKLAYLNDKVVVLGNYMFSSIFKSSKSEGLFMKTFDANGENETSKEFPWLDLKTKLKESKKGRGDFILGGKNKVIIEDIVPVDNGFQIICESYAMSTGFTASEFFINDKTREKVLTVFDFVLFNFSNTFELESVDIFEKEKMNIDLTNYGGKNYSNFLIAEQLRKAQIFPYQYFKNNEIHFINYKNKVGHFAKLNIENGNIEDSREVTLNPEIEEETNAATNEMIKKNGLLSGLNDLAKSMNKLDAKLQKMGDKLDYALNKVDLRYNGRRSKSEGYVLLNNNKKLLYLMDVNRMSVFYEIVD